MHRRRYLQTSAPALTGGLAGCSELGISDDESPSTETHEPTAMPTKTDEPTPHADRGIEPIEPFDTLMFGMDVSEYAGTVQAIVSDVDNGRFLALSSSLRPISTLRRRRPVSSPRA
jgi:hypothetical protein